MSDINKEVAFTSIESILKANSISPFEIPEVAAEVKKSIKHTEGLYDLVHFLYDKMVRETSEDEAWEFVSNEFEEDFLNSIDIVEPKRYDVVEVSLKFKIAVPTDFNQFETQETAWECLQEMGSSPLTCEVIEDDVPKNKLGMYYLENDVD